MTGLEINTVEFLGQAAGYDTDYQLVPGNLSFHYQQNGNVRTLSSGYSPPPSMGFLYFPTLTATCAGASDVPENVTVLSDLPLRVPKIAIAPWVSPACTLDYLNSAPSNTITAFVFYLPDQANSPLPAANDAVWSLGDGGHWKSVTNYPVYAVATQVGELILTQMAYYSGNISTVPYGSQLIDDQGYSPDAYIRLLIDISTGGGGGSGLPSIWVFLLIILAVLLALIGTLSLVMHIIQRKRRNSLRDRIARGEVDVDSLGIKKLTVPQDMINKLPLYTYTSSPGHAVVEKGIPHASPPLNQSTCAICLDDFVPSQSQVRELPCKHVFHPECIDLFLLDNSSVCPLCKQSVLPQGYCPEIVTNAMVRRERYIRRHRARSVPQTDGTADTPHERRQLSSMFARRPHARAESSTTLPAVEMTTVSATDRPAQAPPSTGLGRREWARRRALSMLGPRSTAQQDAPEQPPSRPRKILRNIFPGI